jgi:ATP-dependent Clp protease adaptor protein ClpS
MPVALSNSSVEVAEPRFAGTRPMIAPAEVEQTSAALASQGPWRVVVLNDPVNTMSYVVLVFRKVFGFSEPLARKHMIEVHEQGRSIVWSGLREQAELYAFELQQWHLTASLESDETH